MGDVQYRPQTLFYALGKDAKEARALLLRSSLVSSPSRISGADADVAVSTTITTVLNTIITPGIMKVRGVC